MSTSKHQDLIVSPQVSANFQEPASFHEHSPTGIESQEADKSELLVDVHKLIVRVNALIEQSGYSNDPKSADLLAREISINMKSIKEILAHNAAIKASQERTTYTRYADLPPLHLEDTLIIRAKLEDILFRYASPTLEPEPNSGDAE